jgi:hypothetical protein
MLARVVYTVLIRKFRQSSKCFIDFLFSILLFNEKYLFLIWWIISLLFRLQLLFIGYFHKLFKNPRVIVP